jgi:hypothetical protein
MFLLILGVLVLGAACQQVQSSPVYEPKEVTGTSVSKTITPIVGHTATFTLEPTMDVTVTETLDQSTPTFTPVVRLYENFENPDTCLHTFSEVGASGQVRSGYYKLEVTGGNITAQANCETQVFGNFTAAVSTHIEETAPGTTYYYGLALRVAGKEHYGFVLWSEEAYCLYYTDGEDFVPLTNSVEYLTPCWVSPPDGLFDPLENILQVRLEDERIEFFLNGELMGIVRETHLREGWVGFLVVTGPQGGVQVYFDDLVISWP